MALRQGSIFAGFNRAARGETLKRIEPDPPGLFAVAGIPRNGREHTVFVEAARRDFAIGNPVIDLLRWCRADRVGDQRFFCFGVEAKSRRADAGGIAGLAGKSHFCHLDGHVRQEPQRLAVLHILHREMRVIETVVAMNPPDPIPIWRVACDPIGAELRQPIQRFLLANGTRKGKGDVAHLAGP